MKWKMIGQSIVGTTHLNNNKSCDDSISYKTVVRDEEEVLICCLSDGAGTAKHAQAASHYVTETVVDVLSHWVQEGMTVHDTAVIELLETIYDEFNDRAIALNEDIREYACTVICCVIYESSALFFQIGDGAIIRSDEYDSYAPVWWPSENTAFLVDDPNLSYLKKIIINEPIFEVGLFTDGIQLLTLNTETSGVYQPFFTDLFKWLRFATDELEVEILNSKLNEYLSSERINRMTADDKTLFLATCLQE